MRNSIQLTALLLAFFLGLNETNAQIQNVWIGGKPGRPIDWDVAANWSLHLVPNEFHDVVIPNTASTTFSYPVIDANVEVHSLRIESGAKLVILETGELRLNAVGMKFNEVLANSGEIENRSRHLIAVDESVLGSSSDTLTAQR